MKKKSNLTLFMKQLIRSLKEEERFSTAHIYQSTLNAFMLFCKTDAIRFNQMERSRLKQFENHLRKTDLQDSVISYRRHKTGALLTVEIPPAAMNLIKRYQNTDSASPYLLPILSGNRKSEEEYAEYQHALRKLNYDLKQLAVYCGIKLNVSSYTSRHTWATLAKYCHFSEQLICDALGHSSTKVTETYLKSFKNDELDRANKVIINHINISI